MNELFEILQFKRPYGSPAEEECIAKHLDVIEGMTSDDFGNRIITIGEKPTVLFSSHTDTVHREGGRQKLVKDEVTMMVYKDDGACLGADDGAGMWLMIQLIKEKIPGLYIFHRGEEVGGLGSSYIAHDTPEILKDITKAIAFDRRGVKDIITAQSTGKCCSDEFCESLADALDMGHTSNRGTFTDTANYTDLIEECTNIAVGYYSEHTKNESLDYEYLFNLTVKMCQIDFEALTIKRKKGDRGYSKPLHSQGLYSPSSVWNRNSVFQQPSYGTIEDTVYSPEHEMMDHQDIVSFVMNDPMLAADLLHTEGLTPADIRLARAASMGGTDW